MKKVNIENEISRLERDTLLNNYLPQATDGVVVLEENLSDYLKICYENSTSLSGEVDGNVSYYFYLDTKNDVCVLFTQVYPETRDDYYEMQRKNKHITVKIYQTIEEFEYGKIAESYALYLEGYEDATFEKFDLPEFKAHEEFWDDHPILEAISNLNH